MSNASTETDADVIVVGAGVAGAAIATVLARRGLNVILVDRAAECAPCFKAEKVEPDQAHHLRELGLFDDVRPGLTPIPTVASAAFGRVLKTVRLEQYGVDYWVLANAIRRAFERVRPIEVARVVSIEPGEASSSVTLSDGRLLTARLVVVSAGTSPKLTRVLGFERAPVREDHSLCFGFDATLERAPRGDWSSLTYYAERVTSQVGYITLFPIGDRWRANLFAYFGARDEARRRLTQSPREALGAFFPRISRLVRHLEITSRVEAQSISLYTGCGVPTRPGVLTIGDAYQSVCPATGTGLSKVLTDVIVAAERIPQWLETPSMGTDKLATFYADPRKLETDATSLAAADHIRDFAIQSSLRWRVHRARAYLSMAMDRSVGDTAVPPVM